MTSGSQALRAPASDDPVAAFAAFVREHGDTVWRCLHALGVPRSHIDDAAQDAFVVAFRQWHDYEDRGTPRAWLFAIARRVAADHRRRAARTHDDPERLAVASDVEDALARQQARALVERFLQRLPESRRMVFFLSEIEGWSAPEVAQALAIKLNTVYSRLRRARAAFDAFARRHGGPP